MIKTLFKHISKYYKDTFVLAIAGVAVGVLVGLVDAAFGLGLNACTAIRTKYFWYLIWFLPLGGVFIWFIYHQFGKSVANGMKMVFHVGLGKNTKLPIRMVPLSVIGTWTTHLFGGSAGLHLIRMSNFHYFHLPETVKISSNCREITAPFI